MIIKKAGEGKAYHCADLAKIKINIISKSDTHEKLMDVFLKDYKTFSARFLKLVEKLNLEDNWSFEGYNASECKKKDENGNWVIEYYYICGTFSFDVPIVDDNRKPVAEIIAFLNNFEFINYNVVYTLSEETYAAMRAQATNEALDKIITEIKNIANHLKLDNVQLKILDFESPGLNRNFYESARKNEMLDEAEKIELLEDMMKLKDIEVKSKFTSEWEIN